MISSFIYYVGPGVFSEAVYHDKTVFDVLELTPIVWGWMFGVGILVAKYYYLLEKYFKYFLYGIIYLVLVLFFAVMFIVTTRADVIKPNNEIEPYQVIKIQLRSLKKNDDPKNFQVYVQQLIDFCNQNNVTLLRTVGVMFADTEKRVSDYVN